jgi:hypothetical protein
MNKPQQPAAPPLALRAREAAAALSISPRLLSQLTADRKVPHIRLGRDGHGAVLYPVAELQAWLSREVNKSEIRSAVG